MLKWFAIALLVLVPGMGRAEIVKTAIPSDKGLKFYWWPKLTAPQGWHQDQDASFSNSVNVLVPDGQNFSNAETVIYGKANYKPRDPELKSLAGLVTQDIQTFKTDDPAIRIKKLPDLVDQDGVHFATYEFSPPGKGNWEMVCYGEETEFYLIFTLSSRSQRGMQEALPAFKKVITSYTKGTGN